MISSSRNSLQAGVSAPAFNVISAIEVEWEKTISKIEQRLRHENSVNSSPYKDCARSARGLLGSRYA